MAVVELERITVYMQDTEMEYKNSDYDWSCLMKNFTDKPVLPVLVDKRLPQQCCQSFK